MFLIFALLACEPAPPPRLSLYDARDSQEVVLEPDGSLRSGGEVLGVYAEGAVAWADGTRAPVDRSPERPVVVGADGGLLCRGAPCGRIDPWPADEDRALALADAGRRAQVFRGPWALAQLAGVGEAPAQCIVEALADGQLAPSRARMGEPAEGCPGLGAWTDATVAVGGQEVRITDVLDVERCALRRYALPPLAEERMSGPGLSSFGAVASLPIEGRPLTLVTLKVTRPAPGPDLCADPATRAAIAAAGLALDAAWAQAGLPAPTPTP